MATLISAQENTSNDDGLTIRPLCCEFADKYAADGIGLIYKAAKM
jgi:hypothetical protein